jgi:Type I phosphodiesterase / nucleotide pyrophosphatase
MINEAPLARFPELAGGLINPIYADYSFGNIPNTIEFLLTGQRHGPLLPADCFGGTYPTPQKVVLFFIDSFGWEFWQQYHRRFGAMRRVVDTGVLTPISALFPSTTAASVSTMNLGVLPAEHALYEWNIYIPAFGEVIQSLVFSPLGRNVQDALMAKGYDAGQMLAVHATVHQRLARHGVRSVQFGHRSYTGSAYNKVASAGSQMIPHGTVAEALVQLKDMLTTLPGKAWLSFYWASLDSIAHIYGPGSSHHAAEVESFWLTFDAIFRNVASPDTLYLFTADHGHVRGDAAKTIYINDTIPELADCLPRSPTGNLIYPNGSPRDVFLHVRPERSDGVLELLHRHLDEVALIMPVDEALQQGLFGPTTVCAELRRRLGDILILPYLGHFVWWREPGLMRNTFHGHHGGLTREELITVLGAVDSL